MMRSTRSVDERFARRMRLTDVRWGVAAGIAAIHAGCVLAVFHYDWWAALVCLVLIVASGLGVTLGFHRLLTHRSFATPKWLEYVITLMGCLAWQGDPVTWVGTHRLHHAHSDDEADPHTPRHGFTWAHVFWCIHKEANQRPAEEAAKDLRRDAVHRVINALFWLPQVVLAAALYAAGQWAQSRGLETSGLSWVAWGVFVRTTILYHGTWFVNSAAHTWGYRNFQTKDHSTNLWWVAILGFGEGWHNNHHAWQRSAAHGMRWWELDPTFWTIRLLERMGLAWNVIDQRDRVKQTEADKPVIGVGTRSVDQAIG